MPNRSTCRRFDLEPRGDLLRGQYVEIRLAVRAVGRGSAATHLAGQRSEIPGASISEGIRERWWLQGMRGGMKAHYDCIKAFSETDFTDDLKKIDIPMLVMHGDDDQIVPIAAAGPMSAKLLKKATLKVYPGFPHGMPTTHADQINTDLLAFVTNTH
jgi:pimeloyl-ACP methyl ester carboxylesterase